MNKLIKKFTHWKTTLPGLRDLAASILVFINGAQFVEVSNISISIADVLLGSSIIVIQGIIGIRAVLEEEKTDEVVG